MRENSQPKRKRGGQKGNQNARTHGRYSLVISPRTLGVLKEVMALDHRGQQLICAQLLGKLVEAREAGLLESHSFRAVPEKAEPISLTADFDREFAAWAEERNIGNDEIMREARETIPGWDENESPFPRKRLYAWRVPAKAGSSPEKGLSPRNEYE